MLSNKKGLKLKKIINENQSNSENEKSLRWTIEVLDVDFPDIFKIAVCINLIGGTWVPEPRLWELKVDLAKM